MTHRNYTIFSKEREWERRKKKSDVGRDREGQKKGRKERWNERRKEVKKEEE